MTNRRWHLTERADWRRREPTWTWGELALWASIALAVAVAVLT